MTRLSASSLNQLPGATAFPNYDREQAVGVVHLGTGAFHRAHQAAYFDALMAAGETGWMIQGSSLRSAGVARQMNPQDGLYTMVVRDGDEERHQIVGSVKGVLVAPEGPAALVAALAQEGVALVTLTVTEKGYCIDPATGDLRSGDAAVAGDIANIDAPETAPGFLVAGLKARRAAGLKPFTVLSCDNLPDNGVRTPLSGRLSQDSTVKGLRPAALRAFRPATRKPGAVSGASMFAMSPATAASPERRSPVAGSMQ